MKKKLFKKVLTLAVAGAMVLGMTVPAMAGTPTINTSSTGSLTIYKYDLSEAEADGVDISGFTNGTGEAWDGAEDMSDYTLDGIKFIYVYLGALEQYEFTSDDGEIEEEIVYEITADFADVLGLDTDDALDVTTCTNSGVYHYTSDTLMNALNDLLEGNSYAGEDALYNFALEYETGELVTEGGTATVSGLSLGLYLVVETEVSADVTEPASAFLVSIPMVNAAGNDWNYDVIVYPKNQTDDELQPDKEVRVADEDSENDYAQYITAETGDILDYTVTSHIGRITTASTYYTSMTFTDELPNGLAYITDDMKISFYETSDTSGSADAEWTLSDGYFTFNSSTGKLEITEDGISEINENYGEYYMVIYYQVVVEDASLLNYGDGGNTNKVTIEWARTNEDTTTKYDEAKVLYYGLDLKKLFDGAEGSSEQYTSVTFTLTDGDGNPVNAYYDSSKGKYYVYSEDAVGENSSFDGTLTTSFTVGTDGMLYIYGLAAGEYVLEEISTYTGYNLLDRDISIVITGATYEYTAGKFDEASNTWTAGTWELTENASAVIDGDEDDIVTWDSDSDENYVSILLEVNNTKGFTLPLTGGMGTMLVVIIGAVIICLAVVVGNRRGKRKAA